MKVSFRSFLKRHWLTIIAILVGYAISNHFYKKSIAKPEPVFLIDPARTIIIDSDTLIETPLRVVRPNGDEIIGDITSVRFYFWNNGQKSIKPADILEPLVITLDDPNGEILDYKILKCSRKVVKPVVGLNSVDPNKNLSLSFAILEQEDGFTGQVIYKGNPDAIFSISGIVENADGISNMIQLRFWIEYCKNLPFLICFFGLGAFLFVYTIVLKKPVCRPEVSRKVSTIATLLFICVPIIIGIIIMIVSVKEAQEKATYSVTQTIPKEIIP